MDALAKKSNQLTLSTQSILAQFDDLVSKGELFYEFTKPEVLSDDGIRIALRTVPSFKNKPLDPSSGPAKSATHIKPSDGSDIDHADPIFLVAHVHGNTAPDSAPTHKLIFNKFCVVRPQYLLLTADAGRKQTEPLDEADWSAATQVLKALGDEPAAARIAAKVDGAGDEEVSMEKSKAVLAGKREYFALYNCTPLAGSSRMHKHVQVFPMPTLEEDGMELDANLRPESSSSESEVKSGKGGGKETGPTASRDEDEGKEAPEPKEKKDWTGMPLRQTNRGFNHIIHSYELPFRAASQAAQDHDLPATLAKVYTEHLASCRKELRIPDSEEEIAHNVILTPRMLYTIPRSRNTVAGIAEHVINAAGMLGHIWAGNEDQAQGWREASEGRWYPCLREVFEGLGVPRAVEKADATKTG